MRWNPSELVLPLSSASPRGPVDAGKATSLLQDEMRYQGPRAGAGVP